MNLEEARKEINVVDNELVLLLEKRMRAVVAVAEYKKLNNIPILDEKREAIVLEKVSNLVENQEFSESILEIFQNIMDATKKYQAKKIKNGSKTI
ncbi:chorismate mutase [Enterococcus casseliflavus]|uniref:chorismate mutase n=1 Tax=Enterococcus casseliflavus TaxID=37734 RepID=UPI0012E1C548|nr:chorismate mutase [Enterococcus casseliflavus]MUN75004.1 chorismate mutase [Enterococcus casseliflavus]MUN98128.1 chorismate mutase [Enterococcus casseliflavus]